MIEHDQFSSAFAYAMSEKQYSPDKYDPCDPFDIGELPQMESVLEAMPGVKRVKNFVSNLFYRAGEVLRKNTLKTKSHNILNLPPHEVNGNEDNSYSLNELDQLAESIGYDHIDQGREAFQKYYIENGSAPEYDPEKNYIAARESILRIYKHRKQQIGGTQDNGVQLETLRVAASDSLIVIEKAMKLLNGEIEYKIKSNPKEVGAFVAHASHPFFGSATEPFPIMKQLMKLEEGGVDIEEIFGTERASTVGYDFLQKIPPFPVAEHVLKDEFGGEKQVGITYIIPLMLMEMENPPAELGRRALYYMQDISKGRLDVGLSWLNNQGFEIYGLGGLTPIATNHGKIYTAAKPENRMKDLAESKFINGHAGTVSGICVTIEELLPNLTPENYRPRIGILGANGAIGESVLTTMLAHNGHSKKNFVVYDIAKLDAQRKKLEEQGYKYINQFQADSPENSIYVADGFREFIEESDVIVSAITKESEEMRQTIKEELERLDKDPSYTSIFQNKLVIEDSYPIKQNSAAITKLGGKVILALRSMNEINIKKDGSKRKYRLRRRIHPTLLPRQVDVQSENMELGKPNNYGLGSKGNEQIYYGCEQQMLTQILNQVFNVSGIEIDAQSRVNADSAQNMIELMEATDMKGNLMIHDGNKILSIDDLPKITRREKVA